MSTRIQVSIFENRLLVKSEEFDGPVELGREQNRDEGLYARRGDKAPYRWVVARREETTVGRSQIIVTPLDEGRVNIRNGSDRMPIRFQDRGELLPASDIEVSLPTVIFLTSTKSLRVARCAGQVQSLADRTLPPRQSQLGSRMPSLIVPGGQVLTREVITWLQSAMDVFQGDASAPDFFDQAARAVIDAVGLDSARVLFYQEGVWRTQSAQPATKKKGYQQRPPSGSVLERVLERCSTTWEVYSGDESQPESLHGVEVVVAAPILDGQGVVLGAIYGERGFRTHSIGGPFGSLEASVAELLARGIASGLARLADERRAVARTIQFEQFFTADLARKLLASPELLEGQARDVTVMFCDVRGFTRLSDSLGAGQAILWCREILDVLSKCVLDEGGVLVDYIGDGLMAMWGAPDDQPDHPLRACRAAQAILRALPELNGRWESILGEPLRLGVGINTGQAQVGNVGSRLKFKYGALGTTVNLASRVEGATKFFQCKVLMTRQTQARLDGSILVRHLACVRLQGLEAAIELYELLSPDWDKANFAVEEYAKAFDLYEQGKYGEAARALGNYRGHCPEDDAVLQLLSRTVAALAKKPTEGHRIWEFTEK